MPAIGPENRPATERLDEVLAEYMSRLDAGEAVDRQQFLAEHADLAEGLRDYFHGCDEFAHLFSLEGLATPPQAIVATLDESQLAVAGSLLPGGTFGDYELVQEIARGGMGIVYRARQLSLQRIVALKMILGGPDSSEARLRRFRTEAEAAAQLEHPHIVPIYEVGECAGQPYFSMKLIEGGSLDRQVARFQKDPRSAARLVATVARAVHYAHQHGILHRDLKPANVLLDEGGQPHLTDFGLARRLEGESNLTQPGAIVGTPSYMAPEQALAKQGPLTTAADVYSLGAILYELLTGRPPFREEQQLATLLAVLEQEPARPSHFNAQVPRDLEIICLKCLHKEPQQRYGSAEALAQDLERWLAGAPIQARRAGSVERLLKWMRRQPALAALIAVVLLLPFAGWAFAAYNWKIEADHRQQVQLALEKAEGQLYLNRISLADRYWETHKVRQAQRLLDLCPQERRHWEWHYLKRLGQTELHTLRKHQGFVYSVAFCPDGQRLASTGTDKTVRIWEAATGKELLALSGHAGDINRVAFSPNGQQLASAGDDNSVRLWDAASGKLLHVLAGQIPSISFTGLAFSPDGKRLAACNRDREVYIWNAASGERLLHFKGQDKTVDFGYNGLAFSRDGRWLATAGDNHLVHIWDAATGKDLRTLRGHKTPVLSVAFGGTLKGPQYLVSAGADGIKIWDPAKGTPLGRLAGAVGTIFDVAFSPDGQRLAWASGNSTVYVSATVGATNQLLLRGHQETVQGVAFSPNGQRLASASWDGTVKIWDVTILRQESRLLTTHPGQATWVRFGPVHPQGKILVASAGRKDWDPGQVKLVDLQTGQQTLALPWDGLFSQPAFSADGKRLALVRGQAVQICDAATGKELLTLKEQQGLTHLAFSPDGKWLATTQNAKTPAGWAGTCKIWNADTGVEIFAHTAPGKQPRGLAFSPDSQYLALATADQVVELLQVPSGKVAQTLAGHGGGGASCLAFSPDGQRLAVACGGFKSLPLIKFWNLKTAQELFSLHGHSGMIKGLAFSPDGQRLASAGTDKTIKLWETTAGQEILTLTGPTELVFDLSFSPDGRFLAAASADGSVRLWNATPWPR